MKKLLFLLFLYSNNIFACQEYLKDYNENKKKAREASQAAIVAAAATSFFLGPFSVFVASAVVSGTAAVFDYNAEQDLKKYERCLEDQRNEESRFKAEKSKLNEKLRNNKFQDDFE